MGLLPEIPLISFELNEGEFKGFFDREMHALLWLSLLSLRSLPPEFKMSLSASLSATSLIGIGQAPSLIARFGTYFDSTFSSGLIAR